MNRLELLLPFGLPPPELARDLLRELKMPAFATLLAKSGQPTRQRYDDYSHTLPHERRRAQLAGLPTTDLLASSPPWAGIAMRAAGLRADSGFWFVLQPVNLHIARDHLMLADPRQLALSEADARSLFDIVQPLLAEAGHTVLYGDAQTWFMRADAWHGLQTATPDAACGHNIDIWMPQGAHARDWRRVQNEIQMHWHDHAINQEREMRGQKPVNSVWLWGGAACSAAGDAAANTPHGFRLADSTHAGNLSMIESTIVASPNELLAHGDSAGLLTIATLTEPAMSGDWARWLDQYHALEADWFAPLLAALRQDKLTQLTLTISHNTALSSFALGKSSLHKFWRTPSLARLTTQTAST
jgi:hypothetical protein